MLDVSIFKGPRFVRFGLLDYRLYVKPSSIWKPLNPSSSHAKSVHRSWPLGQVSRLRRRFSCKAEARQAVRDFCERYRTTFGMHVPVRIRGRQKPNMVPSYLVLPHHAVWESARLDRVLAQAASMFSVALDARHDACDMRVSWRRSASNLNEMMRSSCKIMDPDHYHKIFMLS